MSSLQSLSHTMGITVLPPTPDDDDDSTSSEDESVDSTGDALMLPDNLPPSKQQTHSRHVVVPGEIITTESQWMR